MCLEGSGGPGGFSGSSLPSTGMARPKRENMKQAFIYLLIYIFMTHLSSTVQYEIDHQYDCPVKHRFWKHLKGYKNKLEPWQPAEFKF